MRQFYKTYTDEKGYTLCIQLPWSHNRLIMRVQDSKAREWYLREAAREQWSVRQLERNINSFYYQRQLESGIVQDENCTQCVEKSNSIQLRIITVSLRSFPDTCPIPERRLNESNTERERSNRSLFCTHAKDAKSAKVASQRR